MPPPAFRLLSRGGRDLPASGRRMAAACSDYLRGAVSRLGALGQHLFIPNRSPADASCAYLIVCSAAVRGMADEAVFVAGLNRREQPRTQ